MGTNELLKQIKKTNILSPSPIVGYQNEYTSNSFECGGVCSDCLNNSKTPLFECACSSPNAKLFFECDCSVGTFGNE